MYRYICLTPVLELVYNPEYRYISFMYRSLSLGSIPSSNVSIHFDQTYFPKLLEWMYRYIRSNVSIRSNLSSLVELLTCDVSIPLSWVSIRLPCIDQNPKIPIFTITTQIPTYKLNFLTFPLHFLIPFLSTFRGLRPRSPARALPLDPAR